MTDRIAKKGATEATEGVVHSRRAPAYVCSETFPSGDAPAQEIAPSRSRDPSRPGAEAAVDPSRRVCHSTHRGRGIAPGPFRPTALGTRRSRGAQAVRQRVREVRPSGGLQPKCLRAGPLGRRLVVYVHRANEVKRQNLWAEVARRAGIENPFELTPSTIYVVMGALKTAGYRSAEQYLEVAKAVHVGMGFAWSAQLAQARRLAIRSCRRNIGSPKQAGGLPLPKLGNIIHIKEPLAKDGPMWPVRATLLVSWWLLREIEASRAMVQHIVLDEAEHKATWRLPSSKTDQAALGAYLPSSPVRLRLER